MTEWQPIETAPRDEQFLAWHPNGEVIFVCHHLRASAGGGLGAAWDSTPLEEGEVTHWMPLPEPPCQPPKTT